MNPIVGHYTGRCIEIIRRHHQPPREQTYAPFQHAHIYVHFKAVYTLALKQGFCKGNDRRIGCTQKLFHNWGIKGMERHLSTHVTVQ